MRIPQWRFTLLGLLFVSRMAATPLCGTDTLANYILLGSAGCLVNNIELVDTFSFATTGGTLTAADITVTPSNPTGKFQLVFSASFSAAASTTVMYDINFNWDPLVGGAEDDMSDPPGTATLNTGLCVGSVLPCSPTTTLTVTNTVTTMNTFFTSPVTQVGTQNALDLLGGTGGVTITSFTNAVYPLPEPGTVLLMTTGLLALAWRRLRQPAL